MVGFSLFSANPLYVFFNGTNVVYIKIGKIDRNIHKKIEKKNYFSIFYQFAVQKELLFTRNYFIKNIKVACVVNITFLWTDFTII